MLSPSPSTISIFKPCFEVTLEMQRTTDHARTQDSANKFQHF